MKYPWEWALPKEQEKLSLWLLPQRGCPTGVAQCWVKLCAFNPVWFAACPVPGAFQRTGCAAHSHLQRDLSHSQKRQTGLLSPLLSLQSCSWAGTEHCSNCAGVTIQRFMEQTLITNQNRWWLTWGCEKLLRARKETSPAPSLPPSLQTCPTGCVQSNPKPEPSIPEHHNSPSHERVGDTGKRETQRNRI